LATQSSEYLDALSGHPLEGGVIALKSVGIVTIHQSEMLSTVDAKPRALSGTHPHRGGMFRATMRISDYALVSLSWGG
jgi:hypothetical protein